MGAAAAICFQNSASADVIGGAKGADRPRTHEIGERRLDTDTQLIERCVGGFDDFRMVSQSQIVVRAQIQNFTIIAEPDVCLLRRINGAFPFEESLLPNGFQFCGGMFKK